MGKKALDTTPLAGLFLILLLILVVLSGSLQGLAVKVAESCTDIDAARIVIIKISRNHRVTLKPYGQLSYDQLESRLKEKFKNQTERVLFVEADLDLPFQEVVDAIEISQKHVDHVALLTPSVATDSLGYFCVPPDPPTETNPPPIKMQYVPLWPWW